MEAFLAARARLPEVSAGTPEKSAEIADAFSRILAEEPGFARALGSRAYARAWITFARPSTELYRAAVDDAERAIALDSNLADPRVARAVLAWSAFGGWDVQRAVRELQDAIDRAPSLEIAHLDLARIAYHWGWLDEARREIESARRLNPVGEAPRVAAAMGAWLEDPKRALEIFRSLETRNWVARWQMLWIRSTIEDPAAVMPEAEALTRENPKDPIGAAILAILRARSGLDTKALEARIDQADRRVGHFHHAFQFLADVHAIQGDTAGAVGFLRQASETGFPCAPCFDNDLLLAPIRRSPEYAALRNEIVRRTESDRSALRPAP
jgi:tetratricopeptide (TPR) repeat protein